MGCSQSAAGKLQYLRHDENRFPPLFHDGDTFDRTGSSHLQNGKHTPGLHDGSQLIGSPYPSKRTISLCSRPSSTDSEFEIALDALLHSSMGSVPCKAVVDTGASCTTISLECVRRAGIRYRRFRHPEYSTLMNNSVTTRLGYADVAVSIGTYLTTLRAQVLEDSSDDILLGYDWCKSEEPIITWNPLDVAIIDRHGVRHELHPRRVDW